MQGTGRGGALFFCKSRGVRVREVGWGGGCRGLDARSTNIIVTDCPF